MVRMPMIDAQVAVAKSFMVMGLAIFMYTTSFIRSNQARPKIKVLSEFVSMLAFVYVVFVSP